jgi:hypothetical protein
VQAVTKSAPTIVIQKPGISSMLSSLSSISPTDLHFIKTYRAMPGLNRLCLARPPIAVSHVAGDGPKSAAVCF